jgi:hypothetical protein
LTSAFGGRGKKRLNRVFDVIGFVYPNYTYPSRKKGHKRKTSALAISTVLKGKKIKVLTHRPRYIETATVPKLDEGTSSTAEAEQPARAIPREELTELPKVPAVGPVETPKHGVEAKEKTTKELELEKTVGLSKLLSPPVEPELAKVSKALATTPKMRRMATVLDAVLETTRVLTPAPAKEAPEAATACAKTEAGPSVLAEAEPARTEQGSSDAGLALEKKDMPEKAKSAPEAPFEGHDFIIRHASGKRLSEEEIAEAEHYARELKYPRGALVYNGTDEDDFLYCLKDNKEISVCREMAKNMGFLKLEAGLSAMSKDDLAYSLAYNSLKVQKLWMLGGCFVAECPLSRNTFGRSAHKQIQREGTRRSYDPGSFGIATCLETKGCTDLKRKRLISP